MPSLGQLSEQEKQRAAAAEAARLKTTDYLGGIQDPLARGEGGYNPSELAQIELTPEQKQAMITGAGISAGVGTAAATDAATRAAGAVGGNPAALATYRERAAQEQAANAGDAATQARIAASNTGAQRAQAIGGARIGQQNEGLQYYAGLQGQENQNAQNAYGRAAQATTTASQQPSFFDKFMGAAGGALSAIPRLDEGRMASSGTDAIVGENGSEKVVESPPDYLADGAIDLTPADGYSLYPDVSAAESAPPPAGGPRTSWWQRLQGRVASAVPAGIPEAAAQPWNKATPYQQLGAGIGHAAASMIPPRQGANGIFTRPTQVKLQPNETVVPLNYRANARARPSLAELPAARERPAYGA